MSGKANSRKTIFLALGANFAIFVAKLISALITGSGALLAEAVHSLADCGNQGLLLLGMSQSRWKASPDHPLGYGMVLFFWSFLVALLLFSVGGIFSIYEGLHKLETPEPLRLPGLAVGVLAFSILAEGYSLYGCLREVNKSRGERSLWRWFRDSRQSELIVVFGEDMAALLGLTFALVAILATWISGDPLFDAMGSMAIGVLLCVIAVFVAQEVASLLIGQSAEPLLRERIDAYVRAQPEVEHVYNLITLQMGPDVMVATKAKMCGPLSGDELIDAINRVEAGMKQQFPEIRWSFFEPDNTD